MSNYKLTLQTNNTELSGNNTDLQSLIEQANALPDTDSEQATPVISVNASGLITATAGTKSATHQLAFQAAKTITPSSTSQIAVSSGYYTGGDITVNAIPSTYVKPSYTKAAATYIPTTANKTISAGTYLTGKQTIKGDSNLIAENIKSGISIFGVSGNYEGNGSSGSSETEDMLVTRTLSYYANSRVTSIGSYAFYSHTGLTSVSFLACTTIGNGAFKYCIRLNSAYFPICRTINNYAFCDSALISADFPSCTSIYDGAFCDCMWLESLNFPNCVYILEKAFMSCGHIRSASFPACSYINNSAFAHCDRLVNLYLTSTNVCKLGNSNAFTSTPIDGYIMGTDGIYGSIFVPASLVAAYKTATNWTYFSSRIASIDDNIITFYINDEPYQAERDMTWTEWADSSYNTAGIYIDSNGYVYNGERWVWVQELNIGQGVSSTVAEYGKTAIENTRHYYLDSIYDIFGGF